MKRALRLAKKGEGVCLPNPVVGAVIVKDEQRIGEGWHKKFGCAHAEIEALEDCKKNGASPEDAEMYVTLEPCCHTGKTPPCTKAIIASGIKKVFVAMKDPSEKVSGKGIEELKKAGIEVEVGLLEDEAEILNRDFSVFHTQKRPFVTMKIAMSLDGKIAAQKGTQTWLTGKQAQKKVHILRKNHQAILVGSGTIISDNPHLGVRLVDLGERKDPIRIILGDQKKLPKNAQIFRDENFMVINEESIKKVLQKLHEKEILSLLVEGGHEIFSAFLNEKLVDELHIFIAPTILGEEALPFAKINKENGGISLSVSSVQKLGQDTLIIATPKWDSNNG